MSMFTDERLREIVASQAPFSRRELARELLASREKIASLEAERAADRVKMSGAIHAQYAKRLNGLRRGIREVGRKMMSAREQVAAAKKIIDAARNEHDLLHLSEFDAVYARAKSKGLVDADPLCCIHGIFHRAPCEACAALAVVSAVRVFIGALDEIDDPMLPGEEYDRLVAAVQEVSAASVGETTVEKYRASHKKLEDVIARAMNAIDEADHALFDPEHVVACHAEDVAPHLIALAEATTKARRILQEPLDARLEADLSEAP